MANGKVTKSLFGVFDIGSMYNVSTEKRRTNTISVGQ